MLYKTLINNVSITYSDNSIGDGCFVNNFYIDHVHRGQGKIRGAIEYLLSKYNSITLECWDTLKPMYEHLGFKYIEKEYDGYNIMMLSKADYKSKIH